MAKRHEGVINRENHDDRVRMGARQLDHLRHSTFSMLDQAKNQTLDHSHFFVGQIGFGSDADSLLDHPELQPEMVSLLIDWACGNFEQGRDKLEQILDRGLWDATGKNWIRQGYLNPVGYAPIPDQYKGYGVQDFAARAHGVIFVHPTQRYLLVKGHRPNPVDQKSAWGIIDQRTRWSKWLPQIIRNKPEIAIDSSERIEASGDPCAIHALKPYKPYSETV